MSQVNKPQTKTPKSKGFLNKLLKSGKSKPGSKMQQMREKFEEIIAQKGYVTIGELQKAMGIRNRQMVYQYAWKIFEREEKALVAMKVNGKWYFVDYNKLTDEEKQAIKQYEHRFNFQAK